MAKVIKLKSDWSLAALWNETAYLDQKKPEPRDYIYASEIGHPYIDRFLKMTATPYTNPPNSRSLRKFLAGNIWEFIVKMILISCGVYKHEQIKADNKPFKGKLAVHGRLDYIAGGLVDPVAAKLALSIIKLPDFLEKIALRIVDQMAHRTMETKILEVKAISSFAFDMIERKRCAIPQHSLQGYHYQRHSDIPAEIAYICKDDCRMAQFNIDEHECEKLYQKDISEMTMYYTKGIMPPKADLVKFEPITGRFSKNLSVEYSPYLTMVYGFSNPDEYRDHVKYVDRWNRALSRFARVAAGDTTPTGQAISITKNNLAVQEEIIKAGYKWKEILACRIAAGDLSDID